MRKALLTLTLALIMVAVGAFSALAATEVNLNVNGKGIPSINVLVEEGISRFSIDDFSRITGATVVWTEPDVIQISKNGKTLLLTVGERDALLDGNKVVLPRAPIRNGSVVEVPLRFLCETFGCRVDWNAADKTVLVINDEKRNGMNPTELLVNSNLASESVNTCSLDGITNMKIDALVDGERVLPTPLALSVKQQGSVQIEPLQVYIKQNITSKMETDASQESMVTESYITGDKIYIRPNGEDWFVQDLPLPEEFWKEQRDIQSDPLRAAAYIRETGMILSFGDDVSLDGKDYYVINAYLDPNKFQQTYLNLMQQMAQGMPQDLPPEIIQQMEQLLAKVAIFDCNYKLYINKDTLISEILELCMRMDLNLTKEDLEQFGLPAESEKLPEEVYVSMEIDGSYKMSDFGEPFVAPDVSNARNIADMIPQPGENISEQSN